MRVLAYHSISDLGADPVLVRYSVPPSRFATQLDGLLACGYRFTDLDTLLAVQRGDVPPSESDLLLTFDDAYLDLLDAGLPILLERGIPAVAFAVAGLIGGANEWDVAEGATELGLLDGEGLRRLAAGGVEIGSHTASHRRLRDVPPSALEEELVGSARTIAAHGLRAPRAFSYPYGSWSPALAEAVDDAGYEVAFTVDWGAVAPGADPHATPRVEVHAGDSPRTLRLKLAAAARPPWQREPVRRALSAYTGALAKL